jgi:hypothetical protein
VRVESDQSIPLTSIAHPKNPNTVRMHSKIANLKPDLMGEMLVDVVKQLITNHNRAVFMCLFWSPTDVHSLASTMMRTSILDEQSRRHKRLGIDCKVCHGGLGAVVEEFTTVVFSKGAEGGLNVEQSIVLFLTSACGSRPLLVELCFTLGAQ